MAEQQKFTKGPETITISRLVKKNLAISSRSAPEKFNPNDKNKLREESFQNWLESKKQQQLDKREEENRVKRIAAEQEQMKKETAELSYLLWKHKKDQQKKAKELKERQLKEEGERQKKLKQHASKERVNQWMSSSKLKPRPVPSNLGLLSLTATNPPSFFNPHPWVDPV